MIIKSLICLAVILNLTGCLFRENIDKLSTLKTLGQSHKEITSYLDHQVVAFNKLVEDIENKKLPLRISQEEFIDIYGDPVLFMESSQEEIKTVLLYRHPTEYFSHEKAYVYFDENLELVGWEYGSPGDF